MKLKIKSKDICRYLDVWTPDFPKYTAPLINMANQYTGGDEARSCRPDERPDTALYRQDSE